MPDTAKYYPNATAAVAGKTAWISTSGSINTLWGEINNGVSTPQDAKYGQAGGDDVQFDCWFDWTGLPQFDTLVRKIVLSFRRMGENYSSVPELRIWIYTDYPTAMARTIWTDLYNWDTNSTIQNRSIIATNIEVTRNELINLRVRFKCEASLSGGGGKLPDIYLEPS